MIKFLFSEFSTLFSKTPPSNSNPSPNRLGHLLMLGANHLLCVFGIGFQLYSQLKKSLYDGMEVLGRSVVLMASQTTRLGKSSSVMVQDKHMPERSNYSEIDLEWILKILLLLFLVI